MGNGRTAVSLKLQAASNTPQRGKRNKSKEKAHPGNQNGL
jgi:hypothetical protein